MLFFSFLFVDGLYGRVPEFRILYIIYGTQPPPIGLCFGVFTVYLCLLRFDANIHIFFIKLFWVIVVSFFLHLVVIATVWTPKSRGFGLLGSTNVCFYMYIENTFFLSHGQGGRKTLS